MYVFSTSWYNWQFYNNYIYGKNACHIFIDLIFFNLRRTHLAFLFAFSWFIFYVSSIKSFRFKGPFVLISSNGSTWNIKYIASCTVSCFVTLSTVLWKAFLSLYKIRVLVPARINFKWTEMIIIKRAKLDFKWNHYEIILEKGKKQ